MAGIEAQVKMEKNKIPQPHLEPKKGTRGDIDDEDDEESYYRYVRTGLKKDFKHMFCNIAFFNQIFFRQIHARKSSRWLNRRRI